MVGAVIMGLHSGGWKRSGDITKKQRDAVNSSEYSCHYQMGMTNCQGRGEEEPGTRASTIPVIHRFMGAKKKTPSPSGRGR